MSMTDTKDHLFVAVNQNGSYTKWMTGSAVTDRVAANVRWYKRRDMFTEETGGIISVYPTEESVMPIEVFGAIAPKGERYVI